MRGRQYVLAGFLWAVAVSAHHAGAMFDEQKSVTLIGTVREFQFTNLHAYIQLLVPGETAPEEWNIEMGSPAHLLRHGRIDRRGLPGQ